MDFTRVRHRWAQVAGHPEAFAGSLLERVGALLALRLQEIKDQPEIILDLGCRSGLLRQQLQVANAGKSRIVSASFAVGWAMQGPRWLKPFRKQPEMACTHPLALPFANATFDAVVSNLALHWLGDLKGAFREIRRVLKPGGLFLVTLPGDGTLIELRECLATLDRQGYGHMWPRMVSFPSVHQVGDDLLQLGFRLPVVDRDRVHTTFADIWQLLRHLRTLGSCNPYAERVPGLTGKKFFADLQNLYRTRYPHADNRLSVSVEILFGHGWRAS
ncbi:MAG: methyltransferase domain-containing protein [Magnetococcales bacterium]|nr:methyltransferase domain-containing protein [Magnetococcales bacterium]